MLFKVKLASAHKVPFLATGGRHGYTATFKVLQNGLELDLSLFKNVRVDSHANTLTVGGGVTFAEILDPVFKAGREIRKLSPELVEFQCSFSRNE